MDVLQHYRSLSLELSAMKNRVRTLIHGNHWQTDGEWKESVLRSVLRRNMPQSVEVGRGFVVTPRDHSSQIDVLIYDCSHPTLHRDGNLVFISPDAVKGIIEVKSCARSSNLTDAVRKLADNSELVQVHSNNVTRNAPNDLFVGLFAYECEEDLPRRGVLQRLQNAAQGENKRVVNHLALGPDWFIRFWEISPDGREPGYHSWRSYEFNQRAAGYFVSNSVEYMAPESVRHNRYSWYPPEGKEIFMLHEKRLSVV